MIVNNGKLLIFKERGLVEPVYCIGYIHTMFSVSSLDMENINDL